MPNNLRVPSFLVFVILVATNSIWHSAHANRETQNNTGLNTSEKLATFKWKKKNWQKFYKTTNGNISTSILQNWCKLKAIIYWTQKETIHISIFCIFKNLYNWLCKCQVQRWDKENKIKTKSALAYFFGILSDNGRNLPPFT